MTDPRTTLLDGFAARLRDAGLGEHAAALPILTGADEADGADGPAAPPLPVLDHLATALALAPPSDLVDALAVLTGRAAWTQTPSYVRHPPGPGLLDGYAHTTLVGGPPGHAAVGALLLGPGVDYPRHHHPADEVYLPLTTADWVHGLDDDLAPAPPGVLIHHRTWQPHGMRTGTDPLLALYLWTGDVATPSEFCPG